MKRKNKVLLSLLLLLGIIVFSACNFHSIQLSTISQVDNVINKNDEELIADDIELEISNFLSDFRGQYISDAVKIESRELTEGSTEGGEIVRYKNSGGAVLRYKLSYYGEMGMAEHNYHIVNNYIYYSVLREFYSSPVYMNATDVLYRTLDEAVLMNGICYRYDKLNHVFIHSGSLDVPYSSLEELSNLFETSELKD